jgi:prolipoprotein diacylglyceryltransferase
MFPVLQIGPLAIPIPGLALLLGVWIGLWLAEKEAARLKLNPETVYNLAFTGLAAGVIGARLAYVARYVSAYANDPLGVFSLSPAALAPNEGVLIGVAAAFLFGVRRQLPLRPTLDALAPALALMGVALAVAHLASGDAFGAAARLPWSVYLWDEYRHPSQLYELIAAVGVLGVGWWARRRGPFAGANFLLIIAFSAAARIFLEAFRGDSILIFGGLRAAQVWALIVLAACLGTMHYWNLETRS